VRTEPSLPSGSLPTSAPERIAQYLRDNAIQRIFAVGLGMAALAARVEEPQLQRLLSNYAEDLDLAISAIYVAVSELTSGESARS
jgi:signal transduction histidine kinase